MRRTRAKQWTSSQLKMHGKTFTIFQFDNFMPMNTQVAGTCQMYATKVKMNEWYITFGNKKHFEDTNCDM